MKLRRVMAAAAVTAVIAPAALLSATAAYATEETPGATPSASETTPETGTPTPTAPETTPETGTPTPSASETTPETGTPTPTASETTPGATPTATESETVSPSPDPDECTTVTDGASIETTLTGLPSKIVAGSGWHNFTYEATNTSDQEMHAIQAYVDVIGIDGADLEVISKYLSVEWKSESGWESIADTTGYFGTAEKVAAGETITAELRVKVDAKAPAGYGYAFSSGVYVSEDGDCEFSEDMMFEFDILAAGSKPGKVPPAKGKPGKGNKPAPQGGHEEIDGNLASTGSSSQLPVIGLIGGITIVAGAGVVFAMKRRKSADAA